MDESEEYFGLLISQHVSAFVATSHFDACYEETGTTLSV